MNIFKNRPLFCACISAMAVSVIMFFLHGAIKLAVMTVAITGIALFGILIFRRKLTLTAAACGLLCSLLIFFAALSSFTYFDQKYKKYAMADISSLQVEGIILSGGYANGMSSYKLYVTDTDALGGGFYAILECEYASSLTVGDEVLGYFEVEEFENNTGAYSEKHMRLSDQIFMRFVSDEASDITLSSHNSRHLRALLPRLNHKLCSILDRGLSEDAGALAKALFLGNKDSVPTTVTRNFRYAGASHVLAISGMHMSILFGALAYVFKKLMMSYRTRAVILAVLAVFYLALTGFSPSATRSVLMLLFVYLSMLASHSADPLTSLSVAGAVMLITSPSTLLDAGFWMSFAATFGILVLAPCLSQYLFDKLQPVWRRFSALLKPFVAVVTSIVAGVGALMPLIIVLCVFVRQLSLFSVISSLVLELPTQVILMLSPLVIIFSGIGPVASLLYFCIERCCNFMMNVTEKIAGIDGVMISLEHPYIILFSALLLIAYLLGLSLKFKRKLFSFVPYLCALALFFGCLSLHSARADRTLKLTYLSRSEQCDVIVAETNGEAVIFDMTNGSSTALSEALDEVQRMGCTEVRSIVVTDLTTLHISTLARVSQRIFVDSIYVPIPQNSDDYFRVIALKEALRTSGVVLDFFESGECFELLSNTDVCIDLSYLSRSTLPTVMLNIERGDQTLTYLSASFVESELETAVFDKLPDTEHLILGSRGPTIKQEFKLYNGYDIKEMVFASESVLAAYSTESFVYPDVEYILFPKVHRIEFLN